jgi:hypothetical protein
MTGHLPSTTRNDRTVDLIRDGYIGLKETRQRILLVFTREYVTPILFLSKWSLVTAFLRGGSDGTGLLESFNVLKDGIGSHGKLLLYHSH